MRLNTLSRARGLAITVSLCAAMGAALLSTPPALAADTHSNSGTVARHGGIVTQTKAHSFETVLAPHGIRVYIYTDEQAPAMVEKATGVATITLADGKTATVKFATESPGDKEPATYFCPMHAEVVQDKPGECAPCGGMKLFKQDRLYGQIDLSKTKPEDLKLSIKVSGMRGSEKEVTFSPAFRTPERKAEGNKSGGATN